MNSSKVCERELDRIEPEQQESVMQIATSWMEQGIERVLERGRQEEAVVLLLRQLNRRLEVVNPELQSQIQQLSVEQLEALAESLLDFVELRDLVAWLNQSNSK